MKYNDFAGFYQSSMDLFWQGNHAGIDGNKVVNIYEVPPYPAFSAKLWELYDIGSIAFYEWYIPDDVIRFEFCIDRKFDFRRWPSIEGKILKVKQSTFELLRQILSNNMPVNNNIPCGLDGLFTYIDFGDIEKRYMWQENIIPQGLEQIYDFSLHMKSYFENIVGKGFVFGIEGKLYAEFLEDKVNNSEMNFIRSFYHNIKNQNVEIKAGNRLLLSNSFDKAYYELIKKENRFKGFRLIWEEIVY